MVLPPSKSALHQEIAFNKKKQSLTAIRSDARRGCVSRPALLWCGFTSRPVKFQRWNSSYDLAASPGAHGGGGIKRSSFQNQRVPLYHDRSVACAPDFAMIRLTYVPALRGKRTTNDSLSTQPRRNVAPKPEQQKQTLSRDTTHLLVPADSRPTGGSSFRYCHHKPTWTREDMNPQGNAADDSRCRSRSSAIRLLEDEDPQQEQGMEPLRDSTVDVAIGHTQRHRSSLMTIRAGHLALMMNRPMMSRTVIMSRMDHQDRGALGHLETLRRESIREHNENLSGRPKMVSKRVERQAA